MTYRLARLYMLPSVGLHLIATGVAAALAFLVWAPIGIAAVLMLANALRMALFPSIAVRTNDEELRCGGRLTRSLPRIKWTEVESVSADGSRLSLRRGNDSMTDPPVILPLAPLGARGGDLVRDVYDRLNNANGYRRYDPT